MARLCVSRSEKTTAFFGPNPLLWPNDRQIRRIAVSRPNSRAATFQEEEFAVPLLTPGPNSLFLVWRTWNVVVDPNQLQPDQSGTVVQHLVSISASDHAFCSRSRSSEDSRVRDM